MHKTRKPHPHDKFVAVDTTMLSAGMLLESPLYDEQHILLLAQGMTIRSTFLENLRSRRIRTVKIHQRDLSRIRRSVDPISGRVGTGGAGGNWSIPIRTGPLSPRARLHGLPPQGDPFAGEITFHGAAAFDSQAHAVLSTKYQECVDHMEHIQEELLHDHGFDATSLARITDEALDELKADSDLFVSLGINLDDDSYPAKHSTCTGMLSMAMGAQLGLDRPTLKELAIGCLIHDAGMLKIQQKFYQTRDRLDQVSFLEVMKHPILIYDIIANNRRIPQHVAAIAYQTHERCDGSGYPRRRTSSQIDFLAKIAAVADVFMALVSPRPHRRALLPYQAMEKILRGVRQGLFDELAVRALLRTVSLFPIGSHVELSDGRIGQILRSNGDAFDRPILQVHEPARPWLEPQVVDLLRDHDLNVVRVVPALDLVPKSDATAIMDNWE